MTKILISALEPSANLHLKEILAHIEQKHEIYGIFDENLGKPFLKSSEFSAMGFIEILPLVLKAKKAIKDLANLSKECSSVLLIDSPAFNIPLAKAIKKVNPQIKITYYILPQVWAWKPKRAKIVEKYCDNLASILPFDNQFYQKCQYVGHPLLDEINFTKSDQNAELISFLPGSRKKEITRLMPIFKEVAKKIDGKKALCVPPILLDRIDEIYGDVSEFEIHTDTPKTLLNSKFAFICSGTATLQAALIGTPFVLAYRANSLDMFIAKRLVKLKYAGLANIMFDFLGKDALHDELLQESVNIDNLLSSYKNYDANKFLNGAKILRDYLQHGSSKMVAKIITKDINAN